MVARQEHEGLSPGLSLPAGWALLWVTVLSAWAWWVQAQKGRGADGGIAGRGMSPRERLWFVLLLLPPAGVCLVAWLRAHLLAG